MKQKNNRRPVWVGIFILIGTSFFVAVILLLGNLKETFTTKMEVIALFDDVNGLQKGDNIWYSGVKIGTVSDVVFTGNSQVSVSLNIDVDARMYIKKDAHVEVSSDGLLGNRIVVIAGGTSNAQAVERGDTLEVFVSTSTDEVIDILQKNNENLLAITTDLKEVTHQLAVGEGTIGRLLHDPAFYNNLNSASVELNAAIRETKGLLADLRQISTNLNKEGSLMHDLTNDTTTFTAIQASIARLQQVADSTGLFIGQLNEAAADSSSTLGLLLNDESTAAEIEQTIINLRSSSKKLDEDLEALQHNFLLRRYFKKKEKE